MLEAEPQAIEAAAKIPTPTKNIDRRPNKSPREPPTRIKAPSNNPYDSTTHCTPTTVAWSFDWSEGRAISTKVLSKKAIRDPRMVAAGTQFPVGFSKGASAFANRITASSHGGLMMATYLSSLGLGVPTKFIFAIKTKGRGNRRSNIRK